MKPMEGLFVDTSCCLKIISTVEDDTHYMLHSASTDDCKEDGWVGAIHKIKDGSIELVSKDHKVRGTFDGTNCIVWNGGEQWRRLHISYLQWLMMTRRYYPMPLSFLVYKAVSAGVTQLKDAFGFTEASRPY